MDRIQIKQKQKNKKKQKKTKKKKTRHITHTQTVKGFQTASNKQDEGIRRQAGKIPLLFVVR